jgi:hypothetical protein
MMYEISAQSFIVALWKIKYNHKLVENQQTFSVEKDGKLS